MLTLLAAMGYGGVHGSGLVTPPPQDGGIDGLIMKTSSVLILSAYKQSGGKERSAAIVQGFVGSMDLHRSRKGSSSRREDTARTPRTT